MIYIASDLHGEYGLFMKLLEKINFSDSDSMIICGDIIDKGKESVKLLKTVFSMKNVTAILGNHEYAFLKYYRSILGESPKNFDDVLEKLWRYFPEDSEKIDFETVDAIEALPAYLEFDKFICVHSGIPLGDDGENLPLCHASVEELVFDRRFKNPEVTHKSPKCVFFGHTHTDAVCGRNVILGHLRDGVENPRDVSDFYKIHLDTGAFCSGVMGCFCVDTMKAHYVYKKKG